MAKELRVKKKKVKGENDTSYVIMARVNGVVRIAGHVSENDGKSLILDHKKPRSSRRIERVIPMSQVVCYSAGAEEDGAFVLIRGVNPVINDVFSGLEVISDKRMKAVDSKGREVIFNTGPGGIDIEVSAEGSA